MTIAEKTLKKCVQCGSPDVVFRVGKKSKATLNGVDYTELINRYYKKGDYLCEDCIFK